MAGSKMRRVFDGLRAIEWMASLWGYLWEYLKPLVGRMIGAIAAIGAWKVDAFTAWLKTVGPAFIAQAFDIVALILAVYFTGSVVIGVVKIAREKAKEEARRQAQQYRKLIATLKVLRDRFTEELKTGEPASQELGFLVQEAMERMRRWDIPTPNFVGLIPEEMVYFKSYLTVLLVDLENEDLKGAREAINRAGLPESMKPDPRRKD